MIEKFLGITSAEHYLFTIVKVENVFTSLKAEDIAIWLVKNFIIKFKEGSDKKIEI